MSKNKKEIAVVALLILLSYIMLYVAVGISALSFLSACGMWILIGIVYWEKRRAENPIKDEKANGESVGGVFSPSSKGRVEREQTIKEKNKNEDTKKSNNRSHTWNRVHGTRHSTDRVS